MASTLEHTAEGAQTTWQIDPAHTDVGFAAKHLMISTVRGRFAQVSGTILLDGDDLARSSVQVEIDTASIDTRQEQRDGHLRSADFFDAENHPTISFRSKRVESVGAKQLRVVGELTIRGIAREVVLDVTDEGRGRDPWGAERVAFSARTTIDRRDFGLTWNQALETGGVLVGNDIKISIDTEAVLQS